MAAKQGIKLKAINKNGAKYKQKYTISQISKTINNQKYTKYTYSKKIVLVNKYKYK